MKARAAAAPEPPAKNLILRAAASVLGFLAVWWFLLKDASLLLLWAVSYFPLFFLIAPNGVEPVAIDRQTNEWIFNVATHAQVRDAKTGEMVLANSVEFRGERDNVAYFASGWFAYLALAFSAGCFTRSQWKRVLTGFGAQTGVNVLALAGYAYINGYGSLVNGPGAADTQMWLLRYCYHIIYLVVPFAGPFAVALLVHREWRAYFNSAGQPRARV